MSEVADIRGLRFGRWLVVGSAPVRLAGITKWACRCDCGTERMVAGGHLRGGRTNSCGCYNREVAGRRALERSTTHGHSPRGKASPEYRAWRSMLNRCDHPCVNSYERYGGRGITVCSRWRESFEAFLADMGPKPSPKHSVDRIDNDGNYEPGNCRWATPIEQAQHKRRGHKGAEVTSAIYPPEDT